MQVKTAAPAAPDYLHTMLAYVGRYKMLAFPGLIVMIAIAAGQLAGPYILKEIIDVAVPRGDTSLMLRYAAAFLAIVSVTGALSLCGDDAPCTARAVYRDAYQTRYLFTFA